MSQVTENERYFVTCTYCNQVTRVRDPFAVPRTAIRRLREGGASILLRLPVPGTELIVELECVVDLESDAFVPLKPTLTIYEACAYLAITPATLYALAPFMASADKINGVWRFKTPVFVETDAHGVRAERRAEALVRREAARRAGRTLRAGRHAARCDGDHDGRCAASRRPRPAIRSKRRR